MVPITIKVFKYFSMVGMIRGDYNYGVKCNEIFEDFSRMFTYFVISCLWNNN
ncbi:hypothetical protein J19TS1_26510 [Heyndrickxia oleronia]|nr:hypothetical protein J19TS1_26510 [Heyndrickxia oleronia]